MRIKEAFERAQVLGLVKNRAQLAREVWKDSPNKSASMLFHNLEIGKTKKVPISAVIALCEKLQVSADYLFGLSEDISPVIYKESVKEKAQEIISLAETL